MPASPAALARLLNPRSAAIFGVSEKRGALGNAVLANLEHFGFKGDVHLVNPKRDEIGGRPCIRSADALPDGVDVAVLPIPGSAVLDTVRSLAARQVGACVIFAAGFAEGGEDGAAAQAELARIAAASGMVIEGPNCLGLADFTTGIPLSFIETAPCAAPEAGVGIVSQSGALAVVVGTMLQPRGVPVTKWISTGNEAASGVEDYGRHLVDDAATRVIVLVVEQFRSPRRILEVAALARAARKPIVLLHPGRSAAARQSAATHTGALAGDHAVMRVKVADAGVLLAESLEEVADLAEIAFRCPPAPAPGVALLRESGLLKALALDLAEREGLALPAPGAAAAAAALRATLPDFIPVSNPMDLTAQALVEPDLYARVMAPLLADPAYGALVLAIIQTDPPTSARKFEPILDALRRLAPAKPVIVAGVDEGGEVPGRYPQALRAIGIPYFPTPDRALRAVARFAVVRSGGERAVAAPIALELPPGQIIPEHRAKDLLQPAGISFPRRRLARTAADAVAAARTIGFPVALKAQAAALPHKSDAGGVALGLADADEVAAAYVAIERAVAAHAPGMTLEGMLVEAMGPRGVELIVGGRNDPDWGPVVLVGLGGVQAEAYGDVRLIAPGLSEPAIVAELRQLRAAALFDGFRGAPPADLPAAAQLIRTLAHILEGTPAIAEIDLNPLVLRPAGEGVLALDALILAHVS